MLFNTFSFIFLFLPIVWLAWYFFAKKSIRLSVIWLCLASLFFYGYWNPKFLILLTLSIGFNFLIGKRIGMTIAAKPRRVWLMTGIVINLVLLGIFKYFNFFIDNLNAVMNLSGQTQWTVMHVVLPLGISFFTFTQIAFLVDSHRGETTDFDFPRYVLFVTYFPHLIAGPVLHHKQVMPQFEAPGTYDFSYRNLSLGLTIFAFGLFKKVMLADDLAQHVDPVFAAAKMGYEPKLVVAWTAVLAYTFQLYFDFSGYSDMAIGISRMFGVKLPINFDAPYKAKNISEFWQRWHMTLSTFLRDYLYIPLGGNRAGSWMRYRNLMLTMLLGGLWHGANWTFVVWGGLHGAYLVIHHVFRHVVQGIHLHAWLHRLLKIFSMALTFFAVAVGWIFFRAETMGSALVILQGCLGLNGMVYTDVFESVLSQFNPNAVARLLVISALVVWFAPTALQLSERLLKVTRPWTMVLKAGFIALVLLISFSHIGRISTFIYYQF